MDGLIVLLVACLVSGWWFVRNIALYGDPLGWSVWLSDIGVRTPTPALWQLVPELPALFRTYWADLPGFPLSDLVYWALGAGDARLRLLALSSLWLASSRALPHRALKFDIWNLIFVSCMARDCPGRRVALHADHAGGSRATVVPGAGADWRADGVGIERLAAWTKRAWLPGIVVAGLLALTLAAPFVLIRPAFAKPIVAQLPADARPVQAQFGDRVELIGVRLSDQVKPGGTLRVTTYWRALQEIPRDQRLLIRLMRPDGSFGRSARCDDGHEPVSDDALASGPDCCGHA